MSSDEKKPYWGVGLKRASHRKPLWFGKEAGSREAGRGETVWGTVQETRGIAVGKTVEAGRVAFDERCDPDNDIKTEIRGQERGKATEGLYPWFGHG